MKRLRSRKRLARERGHRRSRDLCTPRMAGDSGTAGGPDVFVAASASGWFIGHSLTRPCENSGGATGASVESPGQRPGKFVPTAMRAESPRGCGPSALRSSRDRSQADGLGYHLLGRWPSDPVYGCFHTVCHARSYKTIIQAPIRERLAGRCRVGWIRGSRG
jgi:hypothetical protein